MEEELRSLFPKWVDDPTAGKYLLCLGDDLDSLAGCSLLHELKGYEVNYFYDFNKLYVLDREVKKSAIGVDMALIEGKCWDNHVVKIHRNDEVNPQSANINALLGYHQSNFTDKFCGSTVLQMYAYYGLPLPKTFIGKRALLCIDSTYLGFYREAFKDTCISHLEKLGLYQLVHVLEQSTELEFKILQKDFNMKSKIILSKDKQLQTKMDLVTLGRLLDLDLTLPSQPLKVSMTFPKAKQAEVSYGVKRKQLGDCFTFALTTTKKVKYTLNKTKKDKENDNLVS